MGLRPNLRLRKNKRRLQKLTIILIQGGGKSLPPGLSPRSSAHPLLRAQSPPATPAPATSRSTNAVRSKQAKQKNRQFPRTQSLPKCLHPCTHRPFDKLREHLRQVQGTAVTLNLFQGLFRNKIPVFQTSHIRHLFRFVVSSSTPLQGASPP